MSTVKRCEAVVDGVRCNRTSETTRITQGFCYSHHRHRLKGKEPGPIREARSKRELDRIRAVGLAECRTCKGALPLSAFDQSSPRTPSTDCKDCKHGKYIQRTYQLSPEEVAQLLEAQGKACALCRAPEAGYGRRWHIDHDHSCCPGEKSCGKCVRGALCLGCNAKGLPWYEGLPKEMQTIEAINEYLANPPGSRLARTEA